MTHNNERPWKEAQIQNHEKDDLGISKLTSQKSETISHDPETLRSVNLGNITRIKRRLAINPPSLPLESLSDESTNITVEGKPTQPNKSTNSYSSRSSYSSFSNDTSDSRTTDPLDRNDLGITNHQTGTLLPDLNKSVSLVTDLPSSPNSSEPVSNIFPNPKPFQGIKLEKYTTVTDDSGSTPINDNDSTTPKINPELQSRWATMNLGVSRFRKRLEITSQSRSSPNLSTPPSPGTPSSPGSESGSGNKSSRTRLNRRSDRMQGIIPNDSLLVLDRDKDNSSNLAEVNEGLRKTSSFHVTEEKSNPDTLLTGYTTSHIRTYLVSEKAPATAPLQGLSDSSSSSENEGVSTEYAGNRRNRTSQSKYHTHAVNDRRDESHSGVEIKSQTASLREESDSMLPNLSLTNIPRVKRALNIRAPSPRQSSYKSVSEDKTTDFSTSQINLGVPRIKRRLDIKAPSPQANNSSSASESENEVTRYTAKESIYSSNMSGIIDDYSQITYKRSIMKGSLPLSNSFSASGRSQTIDDAKIKTQDLPDRVSDRPASFSPWRVPSVSPDDVYRKQTETSRGTTDMDLPSEISQTVISRHFSTSITSRHRDVDLPSPQEAPPAVPECSPPDSPDFSRGKNDRGRTDMTLLNTYSYPISTRFGKVDNTAASSTMAVSENKREKRGLTALKVMSTERLKWDIQEEDLETI
nr:serine-rich adhesin for platelets-like [Solea senegalensis]